MTDDDAAHAVIATNSCGNGSAECSPEDRLGAPIGPMLETPEIDQVRAVSRVLHSLNQTAQKAISPICTDYMGDPCDFKPIPENTTFVPPIAVEFDFNR